MGITTTRRRTDPGSAPLWFAVLGPPVLWAVRFGASYALLPHACASGDVRPLYALTVATLLAVAAAGVAGWVQWRRLAPGARGEVGAPEARARFMAVVGVLGSALFFAVVVLEGLALVFIDPCLTGGVPL